MKNVSGYLTDDGTFFQEKKAAEAHEKLLGIRKLIEEFVRDKYEKTHQIADTLQSWEKYKMEMTK
ncbi:hypothetical protein UFOVP232_4 [uncultured Caudovirales phage]|jgi:hypothetical protein|uniref:Uncharacterized protein n=1 Tax=uncultured Caudovirales phage TaxID=2100421 RepID=A0A6J7WPK8_9CAUD|nr:hypothetical protein UFOVP232_4 [uncultured Caudovirales phage]